MKKLNVVSLLLGAALFTGLGVTSAMAEGGKCGGETAPKCGEAKKAAKCGGEKKSMKCGGEKKSMKCGGEKSSMPPKSKCGAGKCGS